MERKRDGKKYQLTGKSWKLRFGTERSSVYVKLKIRAKKWIKNPFVRIQIIFLVALLLVVSLMFPMVYQKFWNSIDEKYEYASKLIVPWPYIGDIFLKEDDLSILNNLRNHSWNDDFVIDKSKKSNKKRNDNPFSKNKRKKNGLNNESDDSDGSNGITLGGSNKIKVPLYNHDTDIFSILPYSIDYFWFRSQNYNNSKYIRRFNNPHLITIISQSSVDRLQMVNSMCQTWNDGLSLSLYLKREEYYNETFMNWLHQWFISLDKQVSTIIDVSICYIDEKAFEILPMMNITIMHNLVSLKMSEYHKRLNLVNEKQKEKLASIINDLESQSGNHANYGTILASYKEQLKILESRAMKMVNSSQIGDSLLKHKLTVNDYFNMLINMQIDPFDRAMELMSEMGLGLTVSAYDENDDSIIIDTAQDTTMDDTNDETDENEINDINFGNGADSDDTGFDELARVLLWTKKGKGKGKGKESNQSIEIIDNHYVGYGIGNNEVWKDGFIYNKMSSLDDLAKMQWKALNLAMKSYDEQAKNRNKKVTGYTRLTEMHKSLNYGSYPVNFLRNVAIDTCVIAYRKMYDSYGIEHFNDYSLYYEKYNQSNKINKTNEMNTRNELENDKYLRQMYEHPDYSPLVFLLDIDFIPSDKIVENLKETAFWRDFWQNAETSKYYNRFTALILPAFEIINQPNFSYETLPVTKDKLIKLYNQGKAIGFHNEQCPRCHGPTKYSQWVQTQKKFYRVSYAAAFEPYIIVKLNGLRKYDARFRGYGLNKAIHIQTLSRIDHYLLYVMPNGFVVTGQHDHSDDELKFRSKNIQRLWVRVLGKHASFLVTHYHFAINPVNMTDNSYYHTIESQIDFKKQSKSLLF